ncbi:hypothetical protein RSAG8_06911, partial [Rhizoctonia solani AG-8 WAC10335]
MAPLTSSQGGFQLQLAQWLLDQLNPNGKQTVIEQFEVLTSQVQDQSIGDFYTHVGKLIFRKIARIQKGDVTATSLTCLCAELCRSLFATHLKQRSSPSPRAMSIHDHLFCLCIDSLSSGNNTESASAHTHSETAAEHEVTDGWVTPTLDGNEISLGRIFELLSRLHEFQLLSLAQLCEYMFRVTEWYKTATGPAATEAVTGMRSLLSSCCPNPRCSPWENEIVSFCKWVDTRSRLDEYQDNANAGGADEAKMQHVVANPEDIMI